MAWKVMGEEQKGVESQYEKDGKPVEFQDYDEAEAFVENLLQTTTVCYWVVSTEPFNREDYFTQPIEAIRVIRRAGEPTDDKNS